MASESPTPAAQYLRMSTEHQQFSLENQAEAISKYATAQGFEIVKSYIDSGKSGLALKHRRGLAQLLSDVVGAPQPYRAILVYDVSRWGRFQDADDVTGDFCTRWNERESTWRKSGSCPSRGTNQSKS